MAPFPRHGESSTGSAHGRVDGDTNIESEPLPDGIRFILPRPGMGEWTSYGWIWLILGNVFVLAGGVAGILGQQAVGSGRTWATLLVLAGAGVVVLLGLWFVNIGMSYFFGRYWIELRGTTLSVIRQSGVVRTRRRIPLVRVRRLRVALTVDTSGYAEAEAKETSFQAGAMQYALFAELDSGGKKPLAQWMRYDYIRSLADRLAGAIEQRYLDHGIDVDPPRVLIDPNAVERATDDTVPRSLPEDSDISVQESEGELSIVVPKLPLLRGKGGQSVGGMLFSAIGAAVLGMFLFSGLSWFWLMFLAPAGITWSKFIANRIGERETYIDVVRDTILVSHASFRGVKQYQWQREQVQAIRCGKSDLEVNDEHLPQLEVIVRDGDRPEEIKTEKHGFLVGRSHREINWIAWKLRQSLGVRALQAADDAEEQDDEEGAAGRR